MSEASDPEPNPDVAANESDSATPTADKTGSGLVSVVISLFAGLFAAMVMFFLTTLVMCAGVVPATGYQIRLGLVIGCSTFPAIVAGAVAIRVVSRHLKSQRKQDRA